MVNHKEILRLKNLGLTHREIEEAAATQSLAYWPVRRNRSFTGSKHSPCHHGKLHNGCFRVNRRGLFTRCRIMSGCTGRCRRAASR